MNPLKWKKLILALALSSAVVGFRQVGVFQYWEWQAVDILFQLSPPEPVDERIVIVGFDNDDMRTLGDSRLNDAQIAQLIKIIKAGKPRAIGLDIFRDHPVPPGHEELMEQFRATPTLYGIGKQTGIKGDPDFDLIDPPPIPQEQIADVSVALDGDDVQRRGFLFPVTEGEQIPSLGLALAYEFLKADGILLKNSPRYKTLLDAGKATLFNFRNQTGPYVRTGDGSYQILMAWRKAPFKVVSVTDVLSGKVPLKIFSGRIIFIGGYAPKLADRFLTPFSRKIFSPPRKMYGVEAQAQVASIVTAAALDNRPLVKVWHEPWISIWIIVCGGISFLCVNHHRWWKGLALTLLTTCGLLGLGYGAFLGAYWVPIVPPLVAIWVVAISLLIFDYETNRQQFIKKITTLNQKLEENLGKQQVYKDLSALTNDLSSRIIEPLHNLINFKARILNSEEELTRKITACISSRQAQEDVNLSLANLTTSVTSQSEQLELICFNLAKHLPNLEGLIQFEYPVKIEAFFSLQEALSRAVNCLRPNIFNDYQVDIWTILKIDSSIKEDLVGLDQSKLIVLLSRILDEILLQSQLQDRSYPTIQITTRSQIAEYQILINIQSSYNPQDFTLYFCQQLVGYCGGVIKTVQDKGGTQWIINLPIY